MLRPSLKAGKGKNQTKGELAHKYSVSSYDTPFHYLKTEGGAGAPAHASVESVCPISIRNFASPDKRARSARSTKNKRHDEGGFVVAFRERL